MASCCEILILVALCLNGVKYKYDARPTIAQIKIDQIILLFIDTFSCIISSGSFWVITFSGFIQFLFKYCAFSSVNF
jgi:hypothetical protein